MKPEIKRTQIENARLDWIKKKHRNFHYINCTFTELQSYIVEIVLFNGKVDVVVRRYTTTPQGIDRLLYKLSSEYRVFPHNIFGVEHGRFQRNDKPQPEPTQEPKKKTQPQPEPRIEATKQASEPAIEKQVEGFII